MSKEAIAAAVATTGILGSVVGVGINLYGKSFRLDRDISFTFDLYPEIAVGYEKFDFDIWGFKQPNKCVLKLLSGANTTININSLSSSQSSVPTYYDSNNGPAELEPEKACLIADVVYSQNEKKESSAFAAKFEFAAVNKDANKAVVIWSGLSNANEKSSSIEGSHRVMFLDKANAADGKSFSWEIKHGFEFVEKIEANDQDVVFEKLGPTDKDKIELKKLCKADDQENSTCKGLMSRSWNQKKGAWNWSPDTTKKGIMETPAFTIKIGNDSKKLFFFGKEFKTGSFPTSLTKVYKSNQWQFKDNEGIGTTNLKSPLKANKDQGSWVWSDCTTKREDSWCPGYIPLET